MEDDYCFGQVNEQSGKLITTLGSDIAFLISDKDKQNAGAPKDARSFCCLFAFAIMLSFVVII